MSDPQGWLERYGQSHQNLAYPLVFWPGLLIVVLGTVGLLWAMPIPSAFYDISPFLNWGSVFLMATTVYYFIISLPIAIGMLPFVVAVAAFQLWLGTLELPAADISLALLAAGVAGLWIGHRNKPGIVPVVVDLQLMMIGPAWLLSALYRRLNIPF